MEAARTENKDLRPKIRKILLMATINLVSMYFGPMTLTFTLVDHHGP
jgi:hypothetical protein